jgi:hypothetical protein
MVQGASFWAARSLQLGHLAGITNLGTGAAAKGPEIGAAAKGTAASWEARWPRKTQLEAAREYVGGSEWPLAQRNRECSNSYSCVLESCSPGADLLLANPAMLSPPTPAGAGPAAAESYWQLD